MPKGLDLLNKITSIRRRQVQTVAYVLEQNELLGRKMQWCGTWLHLREWLDHGGETRLINANFCKKHVLCRLCAARRSVRLVEAYSVKVATVTASRQDLIPAMVTFTVKNGPDLAERIKHAKTTWSKMLAAKRKGASVSGRHDLVQWNHVEGSVRALEVKQGAGGWHPHLHVYCLLNSYIDQGKLSDEWHQWSGDSMIVDVRKCYGTPLAALFEVIKYAVKFDDDMADETLWHVHQVLAGYRSVDPQGCLRGVPEPDIDADSHEGLSGPTIDYIACWLMWEEKFTVRKVESVPISRLTGRPDYRDIVPMANVADQSS